MSPAGRGLERLLTAAQRLAPGHRGGGVQRPLHRAPLRRESAP